jgi:DNA polymerase
MGKVVPGEGPLDAPIMLVGQNPGTEEAKRGRPFVGRAGKYLDSVLEKSGLSRRDLYITNLVKETTPHNRRPSRAEIRVWAPLLASEMELVRPGVVVLMGGVARSAPRIPGVRYIETVHPAAAMRFPAMRRRFERAFADLDTGHEKVQADLTHRRHRAGGLRGQPA